MNSTDVKYMENADILAIDIELERVALDIEAPGKGKTQGCWGPSPEDKYNQC
jgi:hypothetical protein